ncbi:MAG: hypothetical protein EXX96DRAFT_653367 [Benjaminiella poitrasii]|nr:MAG: hypothetical protein EXX96DRAFT_653367 [Benjaminiella poitrasii]
MAEVDIHCNVMKCRKSLTLEAQACVTSCSHIFCVDCSNSLFSKALVCPACNVALSEKYVVNTYIDLSVHAHTPTHIIHTFKLFSDDIILTQLNPTEEYKSSVLAGLKPDIILDIGMRAIAFYEYQTSQEILYRSMVQKAIENKYHHLKDKFEMTTRDLNHLVNVEKKKQIALMKDFEMEKLKSQQMLGKLEEKTRQFQKLQAMYEKLKRKAMTSNMHEAFMNPPNQQNLVTYQTAHPVLRIDHKIQPEPLRKSIIYDKDSISRLGKQSAITADARSIFVPSSNPLHKPTSSTTIMSPNIYPAQHQANIKKNQQSISHDDFQSSVIPVPTHSLQPRHKYRTRRSINMNKSND